jgi:hypothetical protein
MPGARDCAAACAIGNDIFVFGGEDDHDFHDSVFKYDTEADEWSTLASMPHYSREHSTSVHGGLVYVVGVMSDNIDFFDFFSFDPVSKVWNSLAPTLHNRHCGSSFVLAGCLYAAGGCEPSSISSVERYDVASDTWMAVADFSEGRSSCCAIAVGHTGPATEQDLFDSLIAKASSKEHP